MRWQEIWVDITKLEERKQLLAPAFLWEPVMDRHVTVTHQQGSTQNIEKVTQQQFFFFFFFEVRFLHEDPHRFVLLISLFHQMKGMPWMSTPTPLPWAPGSDVTPGRGGGGVTWESWSGCAARFSKSSFPHPYASSDQASKLHTCCKTWSLGRIMSSEIRAQTKNS